MGYLNNQLEKVAAATETGIEKQALSLGRLVSLGVNAAQRGKLGHFAKRLSQRDQAMQNVANTRRANFAKAIPEVRLERAFLGREGPAALKALRLKYRVPDLKTNAASTADKVNNLLTDSKPLSQLGLRVKLFARQPSPMDAQKLGQITKSIRKHRPEMLEELMQANPPPIF